MKKSFALIFIMLSLLSSCRSTGEGASTGASFGAILGSAIGGIAGGNRGHDIGTIVGMATGGAAGAVIGQRNEKKRYERVQERETYGRNEIPASQPRLLECPLLINNLRFIDENGNQTINRGETCKIIFELANKSGETFQQVQPSLSEASGNKHLSFSAFAPIERMNDGAVVRCTVLVKADNRLKAGFANIVVSVNIFGENFLPLQEFSVATDK